MSETADRLLTLTSQIVTAYVGANAIDATALPALIHDIRRSLTALWAGAVVEAAEPQRADSPMTSRPAVDIQKSVFPDYLVCLEDGRKLTMLRRHLRAEHGLSERQYRAKWNLPDHYPLVAPNYSKVRSRLSKGPRSRRRK